MKRVRGLHAAAVTTCFRPSIQGGALLAAILLLAQSELRAAEPLREPLPLRAPVQDKNFFVLSLLARSQPVSALLAGDAELKQLAAAKAEALNRVVATCDTDVECFLAPMRLTEREIAAAGEALRRLHRSDRNLRDLTGSPLRNSGAYVRYHGREDPDLLLAAWADAAKGINNIIDVFGAGKPPRYPKIDSVSYDVKTPQYPRLVHTMAGSLAEERDHYYLFFEPSLRFALHLLLINHRDEAARHEPLEEKENAGALRRIAAMQWEKFPYTTIVVPGYGADRLTWSLTPESRIRLEIAARRFRAGKAPLLIVSGGYVHPSQTPYSEAVEMRKALIEDFQVPADAIIIDPHARHTTTNLRNASRLMYRYGVPFGRKALIVTDQFQSANIASESFAGRCVRELGYMPVEIGDRLSRFDLEFVPRLDSLQIDPMDPLDP